MHGQKTQRRSTFSRTNQNPLSITFLTPDLKFPNPIRPSIAPKIEITFEQIASKIAQIHNNKTNLLA